MDATGKTEIGWPQPDMELSMDTPVAGPGNARPGAGRWIVMLGLLMAFAALVGHHVSTFKPEPRSSDVRLTSWLRDARFEYLKPSADPETIRFVAAFGEDAIPRLLEEYQVAGSRLDRHRQWLVRQLPGKRAEPSNEAQRRLKALTALAVLGCRYPEKVDPLMSTVTAWPECGQVLSLLGKLGPHYVPLLTNIIATSSQRNAGIAIESLSLVGTNAQAAIPLVLAAIEKQWRNNVYYAEDARLVQRMGAVPRVEIERMLILLNDRNPAVRQHSAEFLAGLTNHRPSIRTEMKRMAMLPMVAGYDPGQWTARLLPQVGVPAREALPLLVMRLQVAIETKRWADGHDSAYVYAGAIANYGSAARDAVPLILDQLHPRLRELADPKRTTHPEALQRAKAMLKQLESWLHKMDPAWRRPSGG